MVCEGGWRKEVLSIRSVSSRARSTAKGKSQKALAFFCSSLHTLRAKYVRIIGSRDCIIRRFRLFCDPRTSRASFLCYAFVEIPTACSREVLGAGERRESGSRRDPLLIWFREAMLFFSARRRIGLQRRSGGGCG